ncbi:ATP-dependent helicase HrpB [Vibrio mangrovi]|nr:ATP-dependent helicase HrpB [Vibrio mangrovi]MDW6003032.1 ATP-dependent helicase HrpB [Vibrio mangrovi]
MPQLPIEAVMAELFTAIANYPQVILKAPTGAGKSTAFPLRLLNSSDIDGKIILLEPRRLAAKNIAQYLAACLEEPVGQRVGYRIRGETKVSPATRLEIVTEGVLTRLIQSDPELNGVSLLIFDEFHERSLHADTALALSLEVQQALRDDLKLVIMSATLDHSAIQHLLPQAGYVESEGRSYPVSYQYQPLKANESPVAAMVKQIRLLMQQQEGSLLAFLPGMGMIQQVAGQLTDLADNIDVYPLYGKLSFKAQQQAIQPAAPGLRKIVLATNLAETSLTIDGITLVVDSGLERVARFDPATGVTHLEQSRISQSSAEQRAGRAGRLAPGLCVRLYSESQLRQQAKVPLPEIMRADLSPLVLEMVQWGTNEPDMLQWMTPPPQATFEQGKELLRQLGILDETSRFSGLGTQAYRLGVEPRLASMLLKCRDLGDDLLQAAIAGAALTEENDARQLDLAFALHLWQNGKNQHKTRLMQQARRLASLLSCSFSLDAVSEHQLALALSLAFPDRIAQKRPDRNGQFLLANGQGALIREEEILADTPYLIALDLMRFSSGSCQILSAITLDIDQLSGMAPELFQTRELVDWDDRAGRLTAEKQYCCGRLVVNSERLAAPDRDKMAQALLNYIRREGLKVLHWSDAAVQWLERARCAIAWLPEEAWPAMDEFSLLDDVEQWLSPYMTDVRSVKDLQRLPVLEALKSRLGWSLSQSLDVWLPEFHQLPSGRRKRIRYQAGQEPVLSVRIQEVFGEKSSPVIAQGKKRLVMELLSPAQRPIQITQDLAAFWAGSYAEVKKEMKGRYPKHNWELPD